LRTAVTQASPGENRDDNLERAAELLAEASAGGARLVVLPELFSALAAPARWRELGEPPGGPVERFLSGQARRHGLFLVGGSYLEDAGETLYNTCPVFAPDGSLLGRYRKMHLFSVDIPGEVYYDEGKHISAGDERFVFEADGLRVAVGICYDLRFPEFFRMPGGRPADLYCLGAAFMAPTGRAHWRALVRARAIENLAFFAAAGTVGTHYEIPEKPGEYVGTWGHSMIVDPWGEVAAELEEGEGVAAAEVTREEVERLRTRLAALEHAREELRGG